MRSRGATDAELVPLLRALHRGARPAEPFGSLEDRVTSLWAMWEDWFAHDPAIRAIHVGGIQARALAADPDRVLAWCDAFAPVAAGLARRRAAAGP